MAVSSWSTTAGLNVLSSGIAGTGGTNIDEGCAPSGINNAIRDIMSQIATLITDSNFTLTSTDAGATANPTLTLYRNSASPAASDIIGRVLFQGEDSAGNTEDYADIQTVIADPTSGSEDANIQFRQKVAGTTRATMVMSAGTLQLVSFDAGASGGPNLQLYRNSASPAAADALGILQLVGQDDAGNTHTYAQLYGVLDDPANGSEDGSVGLQLSIAGSLVETALFGSNGLTLTSTDAGAGVGPILTLYRNSATPAASDIMGQIKFNGEDAGGNETIFADMFVTLADPTNSSEDGTITHRVMVAGALTNRIVANAAGVTLSGAVGGDTVTGSWVATQAQQETGTATDVIVTPGRQHFHQSAAKAWVKFDASSGTPTISSSYNITSLTDGGVGITTVNIATELSSAANNVPVVSAGNSGTRQNADLAASGNVAAGTFQVVTATDAGTLTDCSVVTGVVFGDI